MNRKTCEELQNALDFYCKDIPDSSIDQEKYDGMKMIANTVERLIRSLERENFEDAKLEILTFSRQVSDGYFDQPISLKELAEVVSMIRKDIV